MLKDLLDFARNLLWPTKNSLKNQCIVGLCFFQPKSRWCHGITERRVYNSI